MHTCARNIKNCRDVNHHLKGGVALSLKHVAFRYPNGTLALKEVNLTVHHNRNVAVLGPNGGGKSTLLKLILGILKPCAGTIEVMGSPPHVACNYLGYVPQHATIRPDFPITVREIVLHGCAGNHWLGWHASGCRHCVDSVLEEMGIAALANRRFCQLSGGERQRVLIARALSGHPAILLLDEPLANVDPASRAKFQETLRGLGRRMTVLSVSHDLAFLADGVDRVVFINGGSREFDPKEVQAANVQELYRGGGGTGNE
ncbi:MAG: ATP-binding cassette domain-containing protein [Lentisphaeria bacterium]|nr:ATP-binding cassette domain-containing protein [Lentisphaeria bacterium]